MSLIQFNTVSQASHVAVVRRKYGMQPCSLHSRFPRVQLGLQLESPVFSNALTGHTECHHGTAP